MSDRRPTDKHLEEMAADSDGIGGAVPVMARELLELRGIARDRRDEIVCLQAELESKRAQHAETLRLLEHAYEVVGKDAVLTGEFERIDRVTDLFEQWAAEESEHRAAGENGIAEGLHVAIEDLREAVHGSREEVSDGG